MSSRTLRPVWATKCDSSPKQEGGERREEGRKKEGEENKKSQGKEIENQQTESYSFENTR